MFKEDNEGKRIFGSDNTMGLFVALYLILLAFFIVLTTVSNQAATRASAAMESVNQTFTRKGKVELESISPNAVVSAESDPVLQKIKHSFMSELEVPGRFSEAGGGSFEVEFPVSYLFEPGSFRVRQNMIPFLDQLVAALGDVNNGSRQEIAFLFGSGAGPVDREPTRSQEIAIRRAGSLARYLHGAGLERGSYATGFVALPEDQMVAVFRRVIERGSNSRLGMGEGLTGE